jgi:hypothetical protein
LEMSLYGQLRKAQSLGKHITVTVVGWSASMHAVSVCYADTLNLTPTAILYFHRMFGITEDPKTGKLTKDFNIGWSYALKETGYIAHCVSKQVLTKTDAWFLLTHYFPIIVAYDQETQTFINHVREKVDSEL